MATVRIVPRSPSRATSPTPLLGRLAGRRREAGGRGGCTLECFFLQSVGKRQDEQTVCCGFLPPPVAYWVMVGGGDMLLHDFPIFSRDLGSGGQMRVTPGLASYLLSSFSLSRSLALFIFLFLFLFLFLSSLPHPRCASLFFSDPSEPFLESVILD